MNTLGLYLRQRSRLNHRKLLCGSTFLRHYTFSMKPLAIDLYCGLGGWTEALLAEGYYVVGFDIERHQYGEAKYPGQLVLQDVLTLHGSQFKDAALIVASPPCQAYSYRAMPWSRAKALPPPDNTLFEACFRIQREAIKAAGHFIPLVVENVRGAQKWVGRARWNFGSFYLWGDVPALMPIVTKRRMKFPADCGPRMWKDRDYIRLNDGNASAFHHEGATKNNGGSWFAIGSPGQKELSRNPVHAAIKNAGHINKRDGHGHTKHLTNPSEHHKNGGDWFGSGSDCSLQRKASSRSNARKAASAAIAKIPFALAQHIARVYLP